MVALGLHGDVQCYSTITSMLCPHEISERSLFVLLQHANVNLLQSIPQERDLFDECKDLSSYIILDLLKSLLKEGRYVIQSILFHFSIVPNPSQSSVLSMALLKSGIRLESISSSLTWMSTCSSTWTTSLFLRRTSMLSTSFFSLIL